MTEERFSEADLGPSDEVKRRARRSVVDRVAASVATLATGFWVGGLVALGACAAPFVFRMTPAPLSGDAMGAAFARFDQIALGCAAIVMAAEVLRTLLAGRRARALTARARRIIAVLMTASAAYIALVVTPTINDLHRAGARRNEGDDGIRMEALHKQAESLGKLQVALGAALVLLHVFTISAKRPEDEDDDEVQAPLPPGPFGATRPRD